MNPISIAYHNRPITEILHKFIMLTILPAMRSMAVSSAKFTMGKATLRNIDYFLSIVNETVSWKANNKDNIRSVSWLIFLPLLMVVQYVRVFTSLSLFIICGKTLSNEELKEFIDSSRRGLENIMIEGKQKMEDADGKWEGMFKYAISVPYVLFNTFSTMWPMRLALVMAEKILCFLGLIEGSDCKDHKNNIGCNADRPIPESENPEHEQQPHRENESNHEQQNEENRQEHNDQNH